MQNFKARLVFITHQLIIGGFSYQYSLQIDGKPYKTFLDNQTKVRYTKFKKSKSCGFPALRIRDTLIS